MPRRTYINCFLLRCNVKPYDAALFSHSLLALLLSLHFEAGWNGEPQMPSLAPAKGQSS